MNIEAIQKAYATLKKVGITKNPRKAFVSCVVGGGFKRYKFKSLRVVALVSVLQQELLFPSFFTRGITYLEYVGIGKRANMTYFEDSYFLAGALKEALPQFRELLATARDFA